MSTAHTFHTDIGSNWRGTISPVSEKSDMLNAYRIYGQMEKFYQIFLQKNTQNLP